VGFTWGLNPLGPTFAFASVDKARALGGRVDRDQDFVLVSVAPGEQPADVAERIGIAIPSVEVLTRSQFRSRVISFVLLKTPIGLTLGAATLFGLAVGFVIVAIAMFSAVLDHLRELGTLRAIGASARDVRNIFLVQSVLYGLGGSAIGIVLLGILARAIRSPKLTVVLPSWLLIALPLLLTWICIGASSLALLRLRRLDPAMVFRG